MPDASFDFPEWFEKVYGAWFLKGHKQQALRMLATHPQIHDAQWRALIEVKATAWTEHYSRRYSKRVYLFEWVRDEGWRYDPPVERDEQRESKLAEVFREA